MALILIGFVALVLATLGDSSFGASSFSGADITQMHHPWLHDREPSFFYIDLPINDTIDTGLAPRDLFVDGVRGGDIPQWNPYTGGGAPYASTPGIGDWSPMNWVYLVVPLYYATAVAKGIEMSLAAGLTFLFARTVKLSRPAAALAGVLYAGSGFQIAWTNWPHSQVAALIPGVFWGIERILRHRRLSSAAPLAIVLTAMVIGGYPGIVLFTGIVAAIYTVVRLLHLREEGWRCVARIGLNIAVALILPLVIAISILLPFNEQLDGVDLTYRESLATNTLDETTALTMLTPDAAGTPQDRDYFGPRNIIEIQSYVGIVPLLLAGVALAGRRLEATRRSVMAAAAAAAAFLAWATYRGGFALALIEQLPFADSNFIARGRVAMHLLLLLIAAMGFDALRGRALPGDVRPRVSVGRLLLLASAAFAAFAVLLTQHLELADQLDRVGDVLGRFRVPAALGLVASAAMVLIWQSSPRSRRRSRRVVLLSIIPITAIGQTVSASWDWYPLTDRERFFPETEAHRFLAEELGHDRIAGERDAMYPGTSIYYRLRTTSGHYFHPETWADMLRVADPAAFSTSISTWSFLGGDAEVATAPVLDRMGATFFVTYPERLPYGEWEIGAEQVGVLDTTSDQWLDVGEITGPFRGVSVTTIVHLSQGSLPMYIEARATTPDGNTITGSRRVLGVPAADVWVGLPADQLSPTAVTAVQVRFTGGESRPMKLATSTDHLAHSVIRADPDQPLELVFAEGVNIYRRTNALPRIRWASSATSDFDDARDVLADPIDPAVVLIDSDEIAGHHPGSGRDAHLSILADDFDHIRVEANADGHGWLVVADSLQAGWEATVDGDRTDLVRADHGVVAVPVSEGTHVIDLRYRPRGRPFTLALTAIGLMIVLGMAGVEIRNQRAAKTEELPAADAE